VTDSATLGQVFLLLLPSSPVSIIPPLLHIDTYITGGGGGGGTVGPLAATGTFRQSYHIATVKIFTVLFGIVMTAFLMVDSYLSEFGRVLVCML
jgi:hypothetical protein